MAIRRFEGTKRFLHCNDTINMDENCSDDPFKIQPLIDALKKRFNFSTATELLCIDEQMVPFSPLLPSVLFLYHLELPKNLQFCVFSGSIKKETQAITG